MQNDNIVDLSSRRQEKELDAIADSLANHAGTSLAELAKRPPTTMHFSVMTDGVPKSILELHEDGTIKVMGETVETNDPKIADAIKVFVDNMCPQWTVHSGVVELVDMGMYEVMGARSVPGGYGGLDTLNEVLSKYDGKRVRVTVREITDAFQA